MGVVWKHQGAHYFPIGQRKGLNVGGTTEPFIIATNVERQTPFIQGWEANIQDYFKRDCL
jgi:tRNA-specific 2-thiouridylase